MLLQFNFRNFKSFRDDTTLDLSATKISEFSDRVISVGNEKILPVAVIFGANAHGKSNVLEAFKYMHLYVINSLHFSGEDDERKSQNEFLKPTPFLFDSKSRGEVSLFEVYFMDPEEAGARTYNYGFTVDQTGVAEEWFNYKAKSSRGNFNRIFYRNTETGELDLTGLQAKNRDNIKVALEKETLIVSLGAKLKIVKLKYVRDWFYSNEFADFGRPLENFFLSRQLPEDFTNNKEIQNRVVNYLSAFDESIIGFNVEETTDSNNDTVYRIDAVHKMADSDETSSIPLQNESSGTLKMFALYPLLQEVLNKGSVLFIDEMNSRLHPLLVRTFLITFLDPEINKNHSQIVFTSHDAWQLTGNGLRRDEIWFTEKGSNGVSTLYSLADFVDEDGVKIRKDENYEKNYLLGKYGAIPSLRAERQLYFLRR